VLRGGLEPARRALERCRLFALAESLGGVESLIEHPALMTHASLPAAMRESLGISDGLIRISVGVEDVEDLIADLRQALGTAVFFGMIGVTAFGLIFTPVFYVIARYLAQLGPRRDKSRRGMKPAE